MSVLETICKRRSIRKYQERQIPREDLEKIIEAGTYARRKKKNHRMIKDWRWKYGCTDLSEKIGWKCKDCAKRLLH